MAFVPASRVKVPFRERYRVSRQIFGQSMRLMAKERDLWLFPALSFACVLLGLGAYAAVYWLLFGSVDGAVDFMGANGPLLSGALLLGVALVLMYPFGVAATAFQSALAFCLNERMSRRAGSKRDGMRRALSMLGPIARFSLVASLVSGVLGVLGMALEKLRLVPYLGRVVQALGAFAWAAATFFVIPVLVVERERSALGAVRSSVELAKSHWGKSVAGIVTISLAVMVPMMAVLLLFLLLGQVLFMVWMAQAGSGPPTWMFLLPMLAVLPLILLASVLSQAAQTAYQVALYRYARKGKVSKPYTPETLVDAWAPYQQQEGERQEGA